jgi:hypothetical protein
MFFNKISLITYQKKKKKIQGRTTLKEFCSSYALEVCDLILF